MKKLTLVLSLTLCVCMMLSTVAFAVGGSETGGAGAGAGTGDTEGDIVIIDPEDPAIDPNDPDIDPDLAGSLGATTMEIYFGVLKIDGRAKTHIPQVNKVDSNLDAKPLGVIVKNDYDSYTDWSVTVECDDFKVVGSGLSAFSTWSMDMEAKAATVANTALGTVNVYDALLIKSGGAEMVVDCNEINAGYWAPEWDAYLTTSKDIRKGDLYAEMTWTTIAGPGL